MSSVLEEFMSLLTGSFHNENQYMALKAQGKDYVYAEHINTICNDKIDGLADDFAGVFLIEESYYHLGGQTRAMHHLFLFTEEDGEVVLTSYALPEGYNQSTFTYANVDRLDYASLKVSERFVPARYRYHDGYWEGGSESMFSPRVRFILHERFSKKGLEVLEQIETDGVRTFGYDEPIFYEKRA